MGRSPSSVGTNRQRIVESLRDQILRGEIGPGDPLRQIPLSKEFGVAQSVIREGLQLLEQQGLVTSIENVGVFVREMGAEELIGAYQVREVLEGLAARLCCRTASRADIEWLESVARQIHASQGEDQRAERSRLEGEFHQRFLELSGNETLLRQSAGYRFVGDLVVTDRDPDTLLEEHLAIVEAVAADEPERAEAVARRHVAASAESIRDRFSGSKG